MAAAEKLAEAVRKFPVLYDKSCKDFKDKLKKSHTWNDVAKEVGLATGKEAETSFRLLRNRYSRDKKKVKSAKVSGTGTDSVIDAKSETPELFSYLEWLEPYIKHRNSTTNIVVINNDGDDDDDIVNDITDKEDDQESEYSTTMSTDSGDKTPTTSSVTGRAKYAKRNKTKEDIDKAELQFMQKIGNRLEQQTKKSVEKDEESIFGELIATQLRKLPAQDRIIAKMEITNAVYSRMLRSYQPNPAGGIYQGSNTHGFSPNLESTPSQPSQVQAPQMTGFRLPEFETVGHPPLFNAGYFFQQHQQKEN